MDEIKIPKDEKADDDARWYHRRRMNAIRKQRQMAVQQEEEHAFENMVEEEIERRCHEQNPG
jgi:hypothetical protein